MITIMNWWYPYSVVSITSAINIRYDINIIVSETENHNIDWLNEKNKQYNGKIQFTQDIKKRNTKAAHTLTRFDYLPEILEKENQPILVTDADIIHQRRLDILPGSDVALWRTSPSDWGA